MPGSYLPGKGTRLSLQKYDRTVTILTASPYGLLLHLHNDRFLISIDELYLVTWFSRACSSIATNDFKDLPRILSPSLEDSSVSYL